MSRHQRRPARTFHGCNGFVATAIVSGPSAVMTALPLSFQQVRNDLLYVRPIDSQSLNTASMWLSRQMRCASLAFADFGSPLTRMPLGMMRSVTALTMSSAQLVRDCFWNLIHEARVLELISGSGASPSM